MVLKIFRTKNHEEFIVELECYAKESNLLVKEIFEMDVDPYKAIVLFNEIEKVKEGKV